ncbi:hypothetical protein LSCM1_04479 [Leishmania martiniquensis]|uniref:Uncharacterized protein n=1 Tax=Leishmania martiniquensis TaxID=1580590 RepID=A0A836G2K0_9TRYP|nr:hypothetical protein LSCM1_04479 [Leishmania martiniquensis]
MCPATAQQYKSNALFRVLAFLDNTGTQAFALGTEVGDDGNFRKAERVFAADAAITGVLTAALDALRANVRRLFTDAAEQHALLSVLGAGSPEMSTRASLWITTAPTPLPLREDGAALTDVNTDDPLPTLQSSSTALASAPMDTPWSEAVLNPTSLAQYADTVENEIPIHLLMRLRGVLGISAVPPAGDGAVPAAAPCCCTSSPFVEQLLIDGLDEWLRRCPIDEVKRMIRACGVQPTVLASAFTQQQQQSVDAQDASLPNSLVDFVIDVVFPVPVQTAGKASASASSGAAAEGLHDWLILSYEKNREAIDIEEEESTSASEESDGSNDSVTQGHSKSKRARTDFACPSTDHIHALSAWEPAEGEEVLTAENMDRYLRESPQRIPKAILREARKHISDASITEFELKHHYTAAELKELVKERLGTMSASEATDFMKCPVTEAQIQEAARLTRKVQFVKWILALHGAQVESQARE